VPTPIQLGISEGITSNCLLKTKEMAEREGFEPPVPFRVRRFSRPEPSTTRPPLRLLQGRQTRFARLLSLQQERWNLTWRDQAERLGVEFHDLGEVGQEISEAMIAGIGVIFVFDCFFLQFLV
jgi:hypothetical protein